MNFQRIQNVIDVPAMRQRHVAVIGGAVGVASHLVRCGLQRVTHIDFDVVDETNPARQDFDSLDIGKPKPEALADALTRINPEVRVERVKRDFCSLSPQQINAWLGKCDLLVVATDRFVAQARGNLEAIRLGKAAMWIGLYRGGQAGEVIYTIPGKTRSCYRCIASSRYKAFYQQALTGGKGLEIPSGGSIMDLHFIDAVAAQIAVGILTAGADNRFGRLIEQLGDRNLIQCKMDPLFRLGDPDIFETHLGNGPGHFTFNSIALAIEPERDCPDCSRRQLPTSTRSPERTTCPAS